MNIKNRTVALLLLLVVSICGCNNVNKTEIASQFLIPNSYMEFANRSKEIEAQSYINLGEEYCSDVKIVEEGIILLLNKEQKEKLITRNNKNLQSIKKELMDQNSKYKIDEDSNYKKVSLYFDEKVPTDLQTRLIGFYVCGYAVNSILLSGDTEWSVNIEIINCNTQKMVVSGTPPKETFSYGPKEWKESYNE